ncbi:YugN family protein [Salibacterium qingdaonense]|uniref:YugN-like family protein n=1 Tax=Salibacterium qingdaonense TaxID=266892 RepID=A0A1I4IU55_9BACI|nr:YugN family protein [Salibacterium qingdaonense]SFL57844.1 YugN-like family protein [Salibacterium qingdaonense]
MKIEDYDFHGKEFNFGRLVRIMESNGFIHEGQWDYERVTFDYKLLDQTDDATYYLRVQAVAVQGEIPKEDAEVRLLTPFFGRHYYPHGIEYDEDFPEKIIKKCTQKIEKLQQDLQEAETL